jgi:hypothetical protein
LKTMNTNNSRERDRFWEAYRGCAEENRVRPDRSPFYGRWAKEFDNFFQGKRLKDRSRKDIEASLVNLGKRQRIQPRSSWHGRTLSKKDRGVKMCKLSLETS